jgi:hypothetical protein
LRGQYLDNSKIKSSLLDTYTYNNQTLELEVTFKSGDSWVYKNVDPGTISKVFDSPGSIGSKFVKLIKHGKYQASKQD